MSDTKAYSVYSKPINMNLSVFYVVAAGITVRN